MDELKTDSLSGMELGSTVFAAACGVTEMQLVLAAAFIHQQNPPFPQGNSIFKS